MLKAPGSQYGNRHTFLSPLEEQSEAIFSQLLEHGSNGAELTRNSDLRSTEVESVTLEAQRRWNTRRVKVLSRFI